MDHPPGVRLLRRRRGWWTCARMTVGAAIIAFLVWRLGTDAFLEPLRRIEVWSLAVAAVIAVPTTVACAWRWRLVSRGLGTALPVRTAVTAYYQSQFLNTVLPGGVLGDVHRAMRRGRDVGDVGHGLRAVVWERTAGQVVQVALTVLVLLALPSPLRSSMPVVAVSVVAAALCALLLGRAVRRRGPSGLARIVGALATDLRGVLARRAWPGIVLASGVVVAGHAATFLLAARTAGSTAATSRLVPLALLVLLAAALPTNIASWGPREGAAAWLFAVAGLGPSEGVAVAVVYGVMVIVATLPGAVVLLATWLRRGSTRVEPADLEGAAGG